MSVRHALLALLSEGPKYGLQLREEFEARTGEVWPLNVGQVYTTLQRLERDGLVESDESDSEGSQKGFRITKAGQQELAGWLRTPSDIASPPRDELVMKILVALRVPGTDVREVIQVHRRYLVELMQQWTRIKETDNVADTVDPRKRASETSEEGNDLVFLNEQEVETLFKTLKPTYAYLPGYIAINTGMRIGEVLGLRWQDVDLEGKTLTIKQTLQVVKRQIRV